MRRAWDRFMSKIAIQPNDCWLWTATRTKDGYGQFFFEGRMWRAHRWAWTQRNGPVPTGRELDHFRCDTPACVNPDHVRPAAHRENMLRGRSVVAHHLAKRVCPRCELPYGSRDSGRRCVRCRNEDRRRRYRERKVAA